MRLIIDFNKFVTTFRQIETILKQDRTLKTENKTVVLHIRGNQASEGDIPVFFRTKSTQVCQPLACMEIESEETMSIELPVGEINSVISSFKTETNTPDKVTIEYDSSSPDITLTIFVPQGEAMVGNQPVLYFFSFRYVSPPTYIMTEFLTDMTNPELNYQNLSIKGLEVPLKALAEGYKYIPRHITSQSYVRFIPTYIYMRTAMGMIAYKNNYPVLQNMNLLEDSVKLLAILAQSYDTVNLYSDQQKAKLYIQTGVGGGTFIFNYRTSYNEDSELKNIFTLTSNKETLTVSRPAFERNFKRVPEKSDLLYFTRDRGTSKILCDISSRVMQSLLITNKTGNLIDQTVLKLKPIMIKSALVPLLTSDSDIINFHFGTLDRKTVTIGFTDSTKQWYSLISVAGLFDKDYEETVSQYDKYRF